MLKSVYGEHWPLIKKESGTESSSSSELKKFKKLNRGSDCTLSRPSPSPVSKMQKNVCPLTPHHPSPPPPHQEAPPSCATVYLRHNKQKGKYAAKPAPSPPQQPCVHIWGREYKTLHQDNIIYEDSALVIIIQNA